MHLIPIRSYSGLALFLLLLLVACAAPRVEGRWVNSTLVMDAKPGQIILELGADGVGTVELADGLKFGPFAAFERFGYEVAGSTIHLRFQGAEGDAGDYPPLRVCVQGDTMTLRFPVDDQERDDERATLVWVREDPATCAPGDPVDR